MRILITEDDAALAEALPLADSSVDGALSECSFCLFPDKETAAAELARVLMPVSVAAIPEHLGMFALWALGIYVVGYSFFVLSQRRFADEV